MLGQKRNLSAFRQYQERIASISNEEDEISDCSDNENEENRSSSNLAGKILDVNCTDLNLSTNSTASRRSLYYTPPAKRIKRTPLSTVRKKPLHIQRPKLKLLHDSTALFNDPNLSIRNSNGNSANVVMSNCLNSEYENESQELTIEWSSSDESVDIVAQEHTLVSTQATQESIPAGECTPNSAQKRNLYKRCRKGGYLHQLQQTMENSKTDRKFLEHDKKFGIRQYVRLRVLKVEKSFGVYLATVISPDNEISQIVLNADIAQRVTQDSILESFVEHVTPYEVECYDGVKKIIVQPNKFMLP